MINFKFSLTNPWKYRWNNLFAKHGMVTEIYAWEFNGYRSSYIVDIDFHITTKADHAGLTIMLGLLGYHVEFLVYSIYHLDAYQ